MLEVLGQTIDVDGPHGTARPVDDVSFRLPQGSTLGIVGESGSGKSMLLRSLLGLLPPNARRPATARVLFDGVDPGDLPRNERRHFLGGHVAMVFQDPMTSLNPVRTIGRQIIDPMRFHLKLDRSQLRRRAAELLEQVGIPDPGRRLHQYPHELSGGMRQRVMIAIALSCDPRLLLADEPTTALDVTVQREILDLLATLRRERRMSMVLVSHDVAVVAGQADQVAVMYAGRFVEVLPGDLLIGRARHPYTAALLAARPVRDHARSVPLATIPGSPPDALLRLPGCPFAPRCGSADETCRGVRPRLEQHADDHVSACHHPIPLTGQLR